MQWLALLKDAFRPRASRPDRRRLRPRPESLETRVVPYGLSGNAWPHPELVTLSIVPDGTNVNGYASNLVSTFNARFGSQAAWQNVILKAAQVWAQQTNINFRLVTDTGAAWGAGGWQQGDPNFGDIRIGGYNFGNTILAQAYLPPPVNNYSVAGDIAFNTSQSFFINGNAYDLFTVAAHEIGHALGLYHGLFGTIMASSYPGVLPGLTADDAAGIRANYSGGAARAKDSFDALLSNDTFVTATEITPSIDLATQTAVIPDRDLTTTSDVDWYRFIVPVGTTGTLKALVQSSGLSLLNPKLELYDGGLALLQTVNAGTYGGTIAVTQAGVGAGQVYYVKVSSADAIAAFRTGKYALVVNTGVRNDPSAVNDGQAGYSQVGAWTSAYDFSNSFGPSYRYAAAGTGSTTANWQFDATPGSYDVQVTWTIQPNRASNAPYRIYDGNTLIQTVRVNQRLAPSGPTVGGVPFQSLGVFTATNGPLRVELGNDADGYVIADAARAFTATPPPPVDDGQAGYSQVGTWTTTNDFPTNYGPTLRYAAAGTGSATASWQLNVPAGRSADVQVTWTIQPNRASNAPYRIYDGNTLIKEVRVNQRLAPSGPTVGGVPFQSLGVVSISGGPLKVVLGNDADGYVIADAARAVVAPAPALPRPNTQVANGTPLSSGGGLAVVNGWETRVNTTTAGDQTLSASAQQSLAMDADGNSVVVWSSFGQDAADSWGVYAQRFDADGVPQGREFRVNSTARGDQQNPSVAMRPDGDFVISWSGSGQDTDDSRGVYARRYDASGKAQGGEFRVNSTTAGNQRLPAVAIDRSGNFVISWEGRDRDDKGSLGIYAQRYNAGGEPQGGEFRVNTRTAGDQTNPAVAVLPDGTFVITWSGAGQDSKGAGDVYARRYGASGEAQGGEFRVNTAAAGDQKFARVAVDGRGNFVVAWAGSGPNESGLGIYTRRYDASGAAQGDEIHVNTTTAGDQTSPALAVDAHGNFVVSWASYDQDADGSWGVFAQQFSAHGKALEGEFRVNSTTKGDQRNPSVALDMKGHLAIAWSGAGSGDADGVFFQRYAINTGAEKAPVGDAFDPVGHDHDAVHGAPDDAVPAPRRSRGSVARDLVRAVAHRGHPAGPAAGGAPFGLGHGRRPSGSPAADAFAASLAAASRRRRKALGS